MRQVGSLLPNRTPHDVAFQDRKLAYKLLVSNVKFVLLPDNYI
jgi:hypothetical protein